MQLQHSFQNILTIPPITPQSAIFGFIDHKVNCHLINHILLIFKYYVYETRENGSLDLKVLKRNIHKKKKYRKTNKSQQTRKKKKKIGNHCSYSTYFEIYGGATVAVGDE